MPLQDFSSIKNIHRFHYCQNLFQAMSYQESTSHRSVSPICLSALDKIIYFSLHYKTFIKASVFKFFKKPCLFQFMLLRYYYTQQLSRQSIYLYTIITISYTISFFPYLQNAANIPITAKAKPTDRYFISMLPFVIMSALSVYPKGVIYFKISASFVRFEIIFKK